MNYKNKKLSKTVRFITVLTTGILIGGAAVLGTYTASGRRSASDTAQAADGRFNPDAAQTTDSRTDPDAAQTTDNRKSLHNKAASDAGSSSDDIDSNSPDSTESASDGSAQTTALLPDYRIEREDTIYYIYVDGADETDKPLSNVTEDFYKLVFVWKDRYSTFGAYREKDMAGLVRHITSICRTQLENGQITQEDMDLYLCAAGEIQASFRPEE